MITKKAQFGKEKLVAVYASKCLNPALVWMCRPLHSHTKASLNQNNDNKTTYIGIKIMWLKKSNKKRNLLATRSFSLKQCIVFYFILQFSLLLWSPLAMLAKLLL